MKGILPARGVLLGALAVLAFISSTFWLRLELNKAQENLLRVASNIGDMKRDDAALTLAARLAVLAQDPAQRRTHEQYLSALLERMTLTLAIVNDPTAVMHLTEARESRKQLAEVENRAIDLAQAGDIAGATAVFASEEYAALRVAHDKAIAMGHQCVFEIAQMRETVLNRVLDGMMVAALVFLAGLWWTERQRVASERMQAKRQAQFRTLRVVMRTVMDSFNNFMNAVSMFRVQAEIKGVMTEAELAQIDKASEEARDQLMRLAELRFLALRDLGGIKVVDVARSEALSVQKTTPSTGKVVATPEPMRKRA